MLRLLILLIGSAHAATVSGPGVDEMWERICSVLPYCTIGAAAPAFFSQRVVLFLFPLIVASAICVVIYAGIKMIMGGEEGYTEAKTIITHAAIGLVLAMLTGSIFVFIISYLLPLLLG